MVECRNLNIGSTAHVIASEGIVFGTRMPALMGLSPPNLPSVNRTHSCAGQASNFCPSSRNLMQVFESCTAGLCVDLVCVCFCTEYCRGHKSGTLLVHRHDPSDTSQLSTVCRLLEILRGVSGETPTLYNLFRSFPHSLYSNSFASLY